MRKTQRKRRLKAKRAREAAKSLREFVRRWPDMKTYEELAESLGLSAKGEVSIL